MAMRFSDRLALLVEERASQVVLGLDPDPANLWPEAVSRAGSVEDTSPEDRARLTAAGEAGAGCFVLVRTSNPGAAEIQDEPEGAPLRAKLAQIVDELGRDRTGSHQLSDVGAVTGATRPELLAELREQMPRAIFLLPGVGAQGGRAEDLGPAFAPHPAAGLVSASRSIVDAHATAGGDPALAAQAAAEALRLATWRIAEAL